MNNDIGALLPQVSETVKAIYDWHKKNGDAEAPRGYLGASIIGEACERYLWFYFRFSCREDIEGRIYRLFETGDLEEARFVRELRGIGCEVHDVNPETGKQFGVTGFCGHFGGHMDGCAVGIPEAPKTWHVIEFKTHSAQSFTKLEKEGVEKSKPVHYAQMMIYMGLTHISRSLYLAKNKDNDKLYSERIKFDSKKFCILVEKTKRIIESTLPPARLANRADDWRCKFCDAREICWGTGNTCFPVPYKSCRQCCHATPLMKDTEAKKGIWYCEKHEVEIPIEGQLKGCGDHLLIPGMIADAEVADAGDDYIEFKAPNGTSFICGPESRPEAWTTDELMITSRETVFSEQANSAKQIGGGKVVQEVAASLKKDGEK